MKETCSSRETASDFACNTESCSETDCICEGRYGWRDEEGACVHVRWWHGCIHQPPVTLKHHRVLVLADLLCLLQVFECLAGREEERIQLFTVAFRLQ